MISPETLRRYPLFAGLDQGMLKEIAMLAEERAVEAEEWLFHEGDDARTLFLVLEGSVKLTINMSQKNGRVEAMSTLGAGEAIGWSSMIEPCRYTLGGRAAQKTRLVAIDTVALRPLLDENPAAGYHLLQNLAKVMGERLDSLRIQLVSVTT